MGTLTRMPGHTSLWLILGMVLTSSLSFGQCAYDVLVSVSSDRSNPGPLDGMSGLSGDLYIFTGPDDGVNDVDFWLDDPTMSGAMYRHEKNAPYDFNGGSSSAPMPIAAEQLGDGQHTITALMILNDGSSCTTTATFTVGAGAVVPEPDPTPNPDPTPPVDPSGPHIAFSWNDDLSDPAPLSGAYELGNSLYVHVRNAEQLGLSISRIQFFLDDPDMTQGALREDWSGPYELLGDAVPLMLSDLGVGLHHVTAKIKVPGPDPILQATFEVLAAGATPQPQPDPDPQPDPEPQPDPVPDPNATPLEAYDLWVSTSADRSNARDMSTVSELAEFVRFEPIYIFLTPVYPNANILRVEWYLDDPNRALPPFNVENGAPYDFAGGTANSAFGFDIESLPFFGEHTIFADIYFADGSKHIVGARLEYEDPRLSLPGPLFVATPKEDSDLMNYVRDRDAAIALGKALFWDQQVGSDSLTACATCHYHAGADARTTNTIAPGPNGLFDTVLPGQTLTPDMFPFHKFADEHDRDSAVLRSYDDIGGSQGVVKRMFEGINDFFFLDSPPLPIDNFSELEDLVFVDTTGDKRRRVTGRDAPTTINSIFNVRSFWDGRANFVFNGQSPFGTRDPNAYIHINYGNPGGQTVAEELRLEYASLASQAVGPPNSDTEMAWAGRNFPDIGHKLLSSAFRPLALQRVHADDSVFGPEGSYAAAHDPLAGLVHGSGFGLDSHYAQLIVDAFHDDLWNGAPVTVDGVEYTHMEANFALFWGLAIMLYEGTLISDQTPYDYWAAGFNDALTDEQKLGMEIFTKQGSCITCHNGPLFSSATTPIQDHSLEEFGFRELESVERMRMGDANVGLYDSGFYNIGVRPTEEDLGLGGTDPWGNPLSFSAQATSQQFADTHGLSAVIHFDPCLLNEGTCSPFLFQERLAVNGSFKVPTLRNIALTGPYMHNGSMKNLREVVLFYARGVDFAHTNGGDLAPNVSGISSVVNNEQRINALVAFLEALTDERVRHEAAPFDHPELFLPNDGLLPAVGREGGAPIDTFEEALGQ